MPILPPRVRDNSYRLKLPLLLALTCASALASTQVVMLGAGTPRADPERSGPAVAIIYQDRAYLFDSGPGVVRRATAAALRLKIAALRPRKLNLVFLTHLHSDHTVGLPDLIFSPWVLGRTDPLEIYGPKGTKAMADHLEAAWQQDIDIRIHGLEHGNATGYRVTVHEVQPGVIFHDRGLEITAIPVHHGSWPQAFGYRIKTPDRTIVISGDCSPSAALASACDRCDVFLHEVYSLKEAQQSPAWAAYLREFHTSSAELGQIAAKAKPKLLVLYHQLMSGTTDDELVKEVQKYYKGRVVSAHDLDVY